MDLAKDSFRLVEKVSHIPGLSIAFTLAMHIMNSVQISKWNTARLQYLAHLVANYLVDIAEHMEGKWDHAPLMLKTKLDEFEVILRDIQKAVNRLTSSSRVVAFVNASDRQNDIVMLQGRLSDLQRSILVLLGIDASLALKNLGRAVNSQDALAQATHNRVAHIEDMVQEHFTQPTALHEDPDFLIYTRADVRILRTIAPHIRLDSGTATVTALHEAERCDDGRVIFVKSYQGVQWTSIKKAFEQDIAPRRRFWTPRVLQLFGASRATSSAPIQVYHVPQGVLGTFRQWFMQTLCWNPVELICALYNMQISYREFEKFQFQNHIEGTSDDIIVTVGSSRSRREWNIVYTGELRQHEKLYEVRGIQFNLMQDIVACSTGRSPIHHRPAYEFILTTFADLNNRCYPPDGASVLEELLQSPYENIDLPMIGAAFLERGWIGLRYSYVEPTCDKIGLGDIGYVTDDGFVVVDNVHNLLLSDTFRGGIHNEGEGHEWDAYWDGLGSGVLSRPERLEETEIIGKPGGSWWRERVKLRSEFGESKFISYTLGYRLAHTDAAWKVLRDRACVIIAQHDLTVLPHALVLVFNVTSSTTKFDSACMYNPTSHDAADVFGTELAESNLSEPGIQDGNKNNSFPSLFAFTQTKGGPIQIRDSGAPEMVPFCMSMEAEPAWLDQPKSKFDHIYEKKDGFSLFCLRGLGYRIHYMQLPPGVATPFIAEVGELV